MACPFCKIDIPDDSFFCDQCGQEILVCPKCGKAGKGKMCTSDGTSLVAMKSRTGAAVVSAVAPMASAGDSVSAISIPIDTGVLRLVNKNIGIDLKIQRDAVIGRTTGDFVDIFSRHSQISGKHCQINFDSQKGWTVTDLNSTNGTKFNNMPLKPFQPQLLTDKSFLIIANIEFYVEVQGQAGKTARL